MQDSVAEAGKVSHTKANTFQNFSFVVAAFGIAVGKRDVKRVENQHSPVVNRSGTFFELWRMRGFGPAGPVGRQLFGHLRVRGMHKKKEVVFEVISLFQPCRKAEYNAQLFSFFILELFRRLVQKSPGVFVKPSPIYRERNYAPSKSWRGNI